MSGWSVSPNDVKKNSIQSKPSHKSNHILTVTKSLPNHFQIFSKILKVDVRRQIRFCLIGHQYFFFGAVKLSAAQLSSFHQASHDIALLQSACQMPMPWKWVERSTQVFNCNFPRGGGGDLAISAAQPLWLKVWKSPSFSPRAWISRLLLRRKPCWCVPRQ